MKRSALFLFFCITLCLITGCIPEAKSAFDINSITSYRDIPGVTQEEIDAIEALKLQREYFSYVSIPATEAFKLHTGEYSGFTAAFARLLSRLFDIPFVVKLYDWDDLKTGIDNKIFDFTGEFSTTPQRQAEYFMTPPVAQRSFAVYSYRDMVRIMSPLDLNGLRIGFLGDTVLVDLVRNSYPDLVFDKIFVSFNEPWEEMLKEGLVDAFIFPTLADYRFRNYENIRKQEILPMVFNPVSMSTINPELKPVISVLSKYLEAGGDVHLRELYNTGKIEYIRYLFFSFISEEERFFLDNLTNTVPIVLRSDIYPINFFNNRYGEYQGITVDILAEVSKLTGIEFEIINDVSTPFAELLEMLKAGEASLLTSMHFLEERRETFLWSDPHFLTSRYVFLSKTDLPAIDLLYLSEAAVGAIRGTSYIEVHNMLFPGLDNLVLYATNDDALDALERGEIDLLFTLDYVLKYQINYRERLGFKINLLLPVTINSYFGFNINETELRSIINNALAFIDIDAIVNDWTSRVFDYESALALANLRNIVILAAALFILVLLIFLFLFYLYTQKTRKKREALNLAKLMLDTTPLCCQLFDSSFKKIDCNQEAIRIFGFKDKEDFLSRSHELYPEFQPDGKRSAEQVKVYLKKAAREGSCFLNWTYRMFDGTEMPVETTIVRVPYGEDFVLAGYSRDLREHIKMMNEVENSLLIAQEANRAKSEFLSRMSHEMLTPMNAIIGMTQLAKKRDTEGILNDYLDKIENSSRHLLRLINDLLELSGRKDGVIELNETEFSFKKMLIDILMRINPEAGKKHQAVKFDIYPSIPELLRGDKKRLSQVIGYLLENAIKFTPEHGKIHIAASVLSEENGKVILQTEITDNGIGISKERQSHIFNVFEQGDGSLSRKYDGSGLGLPITKHIIEKMGGKIWVESEPGKGAKFTFTCRLKTGE